MQKFSKPEQILFYLRKKGYLCFIKAVSWKQHRYLLPRKSSTKKATSFLLASPLYFDCGIQIICVRGEGILSTGAQQFHLHETTELIFWRGSIIRYRSKAGRLPRTDAALPFPALPSGCGLARHHLFRLYERVPSVRPRKDRKPSKAGKMSISGWIWDRCSSVSRHPPSPNSWN